VSYLKRGFYFLGVLFLSIILSGCYSEQFGYPSDGSPMTKAALTPFVNKTVEVLPFKDSRPADSNTNMYVLWLIPPFPYGYGVYERPEKADFFTSISDFKFDPAKDLARAASTSFQLSNIFNNVLYSNAPGDHKADYTMSGEIHSTQYTGRRFSYCSSFFTVIYWTLGAPLGTSYNRVALTVFLKDKSGNVIWQYSGDKDDYTVDWMYNPYDDCSMYPELTNQILNEAVMDLYNRALADPKLLN